MVTTTSSPRPTVDGFRSVASDDRRWGPVEAPRLLRKAEAFADAAALAVDEDHGIATELAVLAGTLAADAVCCIRLGRRAGLRGRRGAPDVLARADPAVDQAVDMLRALLRIADRGTGINGMTRHEARRAVLLAWRLVEYAVQLAVGPGR